MLKNYVTSFCNSLQLFLRRTLVHSVILFGPSRTFRLSTSLKMREGHHRTKPICLSSPSHPSWPLCVAKPLHRRGLGRPPLLFMLRRHTRCFALSSMLQLFSLRYHYFIRISNFC